MSFFQPDRFFARITSIDVQHDLLGAGLDCVLLDIDNTVRSRETGEVPRDVRKWLARARDAGVRFCLLSNNWHSDVYRFAGELDLPIVSKACKPLPFGYAAAMRKIGAKRPNTVAVGDQLFTDVVGAHAVSIKAYMVVPLAEVDLKHTLLLRGLERGVMGAREPEPAFQGVRPGGVTLDASSPRTNSGKTGPSGFLGSFGLPRIHPANGRTHETHSKEQ